jgi:putative FmdB family regulatory protein
MPLYEYRCRACGHVYEQYVRTLFATPETICPRCGNAESDKVISACGWSSGSSGTSARASNCAPTGG